jgi:Ala-tRNA(Pro) deacylase
MTTANLMRELACREVGHRLIPHHSVRTAEEKAHAAGVPVQEVANTVVLLGDRGWVRAVLPVSERLDLGKLCRALGEGEHTRLATDLELELAYPMFEDGAIPPFGGPAGDRVILDRRLAERDSVVFEPGSHSESLRMKIEDLVSVSGAEVADICVE